MRAVPLALLAIPLALRAEKTFVPVDMAALGVGNASLTGVGQVTPSVFPFGAPTFAGGGVPFIITNADNQMWAARNAPGGMGQEDVSQSFAVSANNVHGIYTLANLYWGVAGTFVTFRFNFDDDTFYEYQMTNGVHLRDFNKFTNEFSNTVNGTTSKTFYDDPFTWSRIDRQWIDFGAAGFGGKNLTSFLVTDTGGRTSAASSSSPPPSRPARPARSPSCPSPNPPPTASSSAASRSPAPPCAAAGPRPDPPAVSLRGRPPGGLLRFPEVRSSRRDIRLGQGG